MASGCGGSGRPQLRAAHCGAVCRGRDLFSVGGTTPPPLRLASPHRRRRVTRVPTTSIPGQTPKTPAQQPPPTTPIRGVNNGKGPQPTGYGPTPTPRAIHNPLSADHNAGLQLIRTPRQRLDTQAPQSRSRRTGTPCRPPKSPAVPILPSKALRSTDPVVSAAHIPTVRFRTASQPQLGPADRSLQPCTPTPSAPSSRQLVPPAGGAERSHRPRSSPSSSATP